MIRRIVLWIPVTAVFLVSIYTSSLPAGEPFLEQLRLPYGLEHFIGYAGLGFFLYIALSGGLRRWNGKAAGATFFITLPYAIFDEFYQGFIPGRVTSAMDVLVDCAGVLAALLGARILTLFWPALFPGVEATADAPKHAAKGVPQDSKPLFGGIIVYFFIVVCAYLLFPFSVKVAWLLSAVSILFFVGLISAVKYSPAFILLGQVASALVLLLLFQRTVLDYGLIAFPAWLQDLGPMAFALLVVWIVMVTNTFNLVEGFDGITVGMAGVIGITLAVIALIRPGLLLPVLALLILGAAVGLFPFNFQPLLIPLGRTGSMLLGFTLAAVLLLQADKPLFESLLLGSLVLLVYPAFDITFAALRRLFGLAPARVKEREGRGFSRRIDALRRVLYLFCLLLMSATVYMVFVRQPASLPFLPMLLLALVALPGAVYLLNMIGLVRLNMPEKETV